MALHFDEKSHTYTLDGRVVPSVTQIIAPLYEGAFDLINAERLERKRNLGRALHYATELDDVGNLDESTLSEALRPYLSAWRTFRDDHKVQVIAAEQPLAHSAFFFAGTIDRMLLIDGSIWKIDLKTTAELHRAVGVQLAGYSFLGGAAEHHGALRLLPDGTYRLHPFDRDLPDDRRCFLGLLALNNWRKKYTHQSKREESNVSELRSA